VKNASGKKKNADTQQLDGADMENHEENYVVRDEWEKKMMIACMQINGGRRVQCTHETVAIIMIYGTLSSSGCTDAPKHRSLRANNGLGLFS